MRVYKCISHALHCLVELLFLYSFQHPFTREAFCSLLCVNILKRKINLVVSQMFREELFHTEKKISCKRKMEIFGKIKTYLNKFIFSRKGQQFYCFKYLIKTIFEQIRYKCKKNLVLCRFFIYNLFLFLYRFYTDFLIKV